MADSLYPEDDEAPARPKSKSRSDKKDPHTELVSKKLLKLDEDEEVKEGKICKFRVVKDWGDSLELEYVSKSKSEKESTDKDDDSDEEDSDDTEEEMSADEELDSIDAATMKG